MKSEISKSAAICVICGPSKSRELFTVREHEYPDTTDDSFFIHECSTCGLIFLNPRPSEDELPTIYPSNYYAFDLVKSDSKNSKISVRSISGWFELRRILSILKVHGKQQAKSVYDIGCGDGSDLDTFRRILGPNIMTAGIDMSSVAVDRARLRGHDVQAGLFSSELRTSEKFDVVISKHVIEHVEDPLGFLVKAGSLIADGGLLIIDTPNVDSPLRKIFGRHWGGWHTPRHWYLFSPKTIRDLADRAGLRVVGVQHMPINTFWVWGLHSFFFERNRKLADKLFDPVGINTAGLWGVISLSIFQGFEIILKFFSRKTSQMRVVLTNGKM